MMGITMKELAYMAGVSRSTVDRVLNKRGIVNADTEKRILALAKSMGYKPNIVARALSSPNKIFKIGCILTYANDAVHSLVRRGVEAAVEEVSVFGIQAVIKSMHELNVQEQLRFLSELESENVQALIIAPINDPVIAEKLRGFIRKGIIVVSVMADIAGVDYLAYVGCDHYRSGRIAANLMSLIAARKTKKVASFIGSKKMLGHEQRINGFCSAIKEKYSNLNLVNISETQDDEFITFTQTGKVLVEYPDVELMFYVGAGVRGGINAILESPQNGSVKVIAYDLYDSTRKYLLDGTIVTAAIFQDPYNQGYTAVKIVSDYLLHRKTPKNNRIYMNVEIAVAETFRD